MRRRTFLTVSNEGIKTSESVGGDVCFYNKTTQKLLIVKTEDFSFESYPSENYSPVGVVVVPGSHNVYGDGSCAVMSLKPMNYSTPDNGGDYKVLYWGYSNLNKQILPFYNYVPYVGKRSADFSSNNPGDEKSTIIGQYNSGYMASSENAIQNNPHDTDTYWSSAGGNVTYYIPSPYLTDDTRNPAYYQTSSPSSSGNCLSDFNGIQNTNTILNNSTSQYEWQISSTITNKSTEGYYPAACCCWRYHTEGTKQGDWYLPAMGELGYLPSKYKLIDDTLTLLKDTYGLAINLNRDYTYWSSTGYYNSNARFLYLNEFTISLFYSSNTSARAFLRVK